MDRRDSLAAIGTISLGYLLGIGPLEEEAGEEMKLEEVLIEQITEKQLADFIVLFTDLLEQRARQVGQGRWDRHIMSLELFQRIYRTHLGSYRVSGPVISMIASGLRAYHEFTEEQLPEAKDHPASKEFVQQLSQEEESEELQTLIDFMNQDLVIPIINALAEQDTVQ